MSASHGYVATIIFLTILLCLRTLIFVPFSYYSDFVIEARHGFNKQTVTFFIKDKIKKLLLTLFFGIFIGVVTLFIINKTGESFADYLTQFVFIFIFYIYGEFIAPLFDTFRELPQSELRTRIEDLASSLNFPLHRLFVVEGNFLLFYFLGSKRSSHSNAYVTGFYKKKKIVLYDTLIGTDNSENIQLFITFKTCGYFLYNSKFYNAFGFGTVNVSEMPPLIGLVLIAQYLISPLQELLNILMVTATRYNEFGADRFSTMIGYGDYLQSALKKLYRNNLSFIYDDWLYAKLKYTHPPLIERLDAIINDSKKIS
ncbi:CAAX prenyl protease 1 homolog [Octopus sinensis]|uniref:CAAX prenyl protease n=1 Tax=Octopus sinensis TaxID=2607531 RepID=A0A6P7TT87_9MOLL|nr:CAAX prenyl protease 1 homolog [Octopus sinensis]